MKIIIRLFALFLVTVRFFYFKSQFAKFSFSSRIVSPLHLHGMSNIKIGNKSIIQYKSWLAALPLTGEEKCTLEIGNGVVIGHFNHIYATKSIIIEDNVLTADKVYISDNLHGYEDIKIPIIKQSIIQNGEVIIGEGSWLGENVCVLGAKIGKHCVIGANSVVTHDIPNYSVAVGIPAKVIKQYNFFSNSWERKI